MRCGVADGVLIQNFLSTRGWNFGSAPDKVLKRDIALSPPSVVRVSLRLITFKLKGKGPSRRREKKISRDDSNYTLLDRQTIFGAACNQLARRFLTRQRRAISTMTPRCPCPVVWEKENLGPAVARAFARRRKKRKRTKVSNVGNQRTIKRLVL